MEHSWNQDTCLALDLGETGGPGLTSRDQSGGYGHGFCEYWVRSCLSFGPGNRAGRQGDLYLLSTPPHGTPCVGGALVSSPFPPVSALPLGGRAPLLFGWGARLSGAARFPDIGRWGPPPSSWGNCRGQKIAVHGGRGGTGG